MPALHPYSDGSHPKLLITGATGYVGQWVLRTILDRGYDARVVIRSEGKANSVKSLFSSPGDESKLEFVVVEDFTKTGALDEAVVDMDGIIHVATPLPRREESPEDTLRIAVEAVEGVLKSALKNGNKSKRVVFTSSIATVIAPVTDRAEPQVFSEEDWNEVTMAKLDAGERDFFPVYFGSKILAERAVLEFGKKHKDEISWDVAVLNPAFVYGPTLEPVSTATDLPSTATLWMGSILSSSISPIAESVDNSWVDVRDLGEAHVRCLEKEEAGGERILACASSYTWKEWFDIVRAVAPSVMGTEKAAEFVKGFPEPLSEQAQYMVKYDPSKCDRILDIKYRTKEEMVKDVLEQGVREGWL